MGTTFGLFVLIASGSGLVHNWMTATQAPPPRPLPSEPLSLDRNIQSPSLVWSRLSQAPDVPPSSVSLRVIEGKTVYQFSDASGIRYADAVSGDELQNGDRDYAAEIARRYFGGAEPVFTKYLETFDSEYIAIFRILPVYRFDLEDEAGNRVYVSTSTGTVTRATNNRGQFQASVFSLFHKFAFIGNRTLRNLILTCTTCGIFLAALTGLTLAWLPTFKRGGGLTSDR